MKIKIKRTDSCLLPIPKYETEGASGFDLRANTDRAIELGPGNRYTFPTGFKFEVPTGYELQIRPRSGLARKYGVSAVMGTVDSDFRGEVQVVVQNHGRLSYVIQPGDRIAQGIIQKVEQVEFEETKELSKTNRSEDGFGSTGTK